MANFFDEYDDPDKKPNAGQNYFDQFDQSKTDLAPPPAPTFTDRLMSHLAGPFQGAGQAADDYVRTITDAATFGGADRLASWAGGTKLDDERAQTEAAKSRLGWMSVPADLVGYYASPIGIGGRAAEGAGILGRGVLGAAGRGAVEGAAAGGTSAVGHDQNIPGQVLRGGVFGAGGGALGGLLSRDIPKGVPAPLTKDLMDAKNAAYDATQQYKYSPSDLQSLNTAVQADAKQAGISKLGTPGAHSFYADFGQRVRNANAPISMQELRDIGDRAYQRSGSQTEFGDIFNKHLDDFFENTHPIGSTADEASDALDAANAANKRYKNSQMLDQWQYDADTGGASVPSQAGEYLRGSDSRKFLSSDQRKALEDVVAGTPLGNVGDFASSHAYRLGHLAGFGALGALGAYGTGHEFMPLAEGAAALGVGYPALQVGGKAASNWANAPLVDLARRSLTDTPYNRFTDPAVADAWRTLLLGGIGY